MSEPTRYYPAGDGVVRTDPKGPLINHYYYEELQAENARLKAQVERLEKVEFAVGVIRNILGDHFGRHYYYKVDYAMRGETLETHE